MGLLDALSSDDAKLGIALLSASGYSPTPMSFGQRLGGALGQFNADRQSSADRALKTKLLQSQIDENASQNLLRQGQLERQKRQDEYYLGGSVAPMTAPGAPGGPGSAAPGAVLKSAIGAPADAPPPGRGKFAEWSQQYGIPIDALVTDYMSNGGKGIADMLMKRGTPDMQVSNGYAYDKNRIGAGYLPQLNMSQDGKASMVQIGLDGLPVVSAPRGAVDTYANYQGIQDRSRAANTPGRPTILPGGRMGGQSQLAEINGGAPASSVSAGVPSGSPTAFTSLPPAQAGVTGNFSGDQSRIIAAIADIRDPQERSNALAAFEQQMKAAPQSSVAGGGLEFSPQEQATNDAKKTFGTETAKADSDQLAKWRGAAEAGNNMLTTAQNLRNAISQGVYSGGGAQAKTAVANMINGITGVTLKSLPGSELFNAEASKLVLESIKGLGANPSNADREFIERTIPQLEKSPQARDALIQFLEKKGKGALDLYQRADSYSREKGGLGGFNQFEQPKNTRQAVKSGMYGGKRVIQYSDGSIEYAN